MKIHSVEVEFSAGTSIERGCREAIKLATTLETVVAFAFNGIKFYVNDRDTVEDLVKTYHKRTAPIGRPQHATEGEK